jgi:hypothetical protein
MVNGRHRFFREAAALLERAWQTDDPREASELVKQAADVLALVAELNAPIGQRSACTNARGPTPS